MSDIELLKMAASAISLDYIECGRLDGSGDLIASATGKTWNPLTNDGDALRLAVKLCLVINIGEMSATVCGEFDSEIGTIFGDDPYAATRRAIVRAAAEIGKQ